MFSPPVYFGRSGGGLRPGIDRDAFFFLFSFTSLCLQEEEFHKLILSLDARGKREGELRQALQERFDIAGLERSVKDR